MRYPIGILGTKEEYQQFWYSAQIFGAKTSYGYHEGVDINLLTGKDTDLGQPLYAIANGKIIYYHYGSHPNSRFGRHLVYRIDGPWGSRWVHYAHCGEKDFVASVQNIVEGQKIAELGKSGDQPQYAHLHLSIFKVDPVTIGGIDRFARTRKELNDWWEDPLIFIETWSQPIEQPLITDTTRIPQINNMTVLEIRNVLDSQREIIDAIKEIVNH